MSKSKRAAVIGPRGVEELRLSEGFAYCKATDYLCACLSGISPDLVTYVEKHGFPQAEEGHKPWQFKGWLLWNVILCSFDSRVVNRWDYWFRTWASGRILEEPIPKIQFQSPHAYMGGGLSHLEGLIDLCFREGRSSNDFRLFCDFLSWGLATSNEPPAIPDGLAEKLYRTLNLEPLLLEPSDYLGAILSSQKVNRHNRTAFYPTPAEIVECMAQITLAGKDPEVIKRQTMCDPCMGTGRMQLHMSNHSLRLSGADIDGQVLQIAKINFALYAPWAMWPFPEEWFIGHLSE